MGPFGDAVGGAAVCGHELVSNAFSLEIEGEFSVEDSPTDQGDGFDRPRSYTFQVLDTPPHKRSAPLLELEGLCEGVVGVGVAYDDPVPVTTEALWEGAS